MHRILAALLIVVAGAVIWFATAAEHSAHATQHFASEDEAHIIRIPHGRVLYVVIDSDGIYLGEQRIDPRFAKDAVNTLLRKEKIRNLVIYGTDLARYGDVIDLYAGIEPALVKWSTFHFLSEPVGTRKPLTGFLRPVCCFAEDVENRTPDEE